MLLSFQPPRTCSSTDPLQADRQGVSEWVLRQGRKLVQNLGFQQQYSRPTFGLSVIRRTAKGGLISFTCFRCFGYRGGRRHHRIAPVEAQPHKPRFWTCFRLVSQCVRHCYLLALRPGGWTQSTFCDSFIFCNHDLHFCIRRADACVLPPSLCHFLSPHLTRRRRSCKAAIEFELSDTIGNALVFSPLIPSSAR